MELAKARNGLACRLETGLDLGSCRRSGPRSRAQRPFGLGRKFSILLIQVLLFFVEGAEQFVEGSVQRLAVFLHRLGEVLLLLAEGRKQLLVQLRELAIHALELFRLFRRDRISGQVENLLGRAALSRGLGRSQGGDGDC